MIKYKGLPKSQQAIEHDESAHKMDLDKFEIAKIILKSQDEAILHEAILAYINTLSYNACWDFAHNEEFENGLYISKIVFKWNGCIGAVDACSKLHFRDLQVEWKLNGEMRGN